MDESRKNLVLQAEPEPHAYDTIMSPAHDATRMQLRVDRLEEGIRRHFARPECLSFLEVGFSDGLHLLEWKKRFPEAQIEGVEVREECVDRMRAKGFDCRTVDRELFDSGKTYDVIYGGAILHHISTPYAYLQHLYGMLNAGGVYLFRE